MMVLYVCGAYVIYTMYDYFLPFYWHQYPRKNGEDILLRMRDALATCNIEEASLNMHMEESYAPHAFHQIRRRMMTGYGRDPDDPRCVHISTFNRKHKVREHYLEKIGVGRMMSMASQGEIHDFKKHNEHLECDDCL